MLISCQPDELDNGNGLNAGEMDAGFTVTTTDESNTYLLEANQVTSIWIKNFISSSSDYKTSSHSQIPLGSQIALETGLTTLMEEL